MSQIKKDKKIELFAQGEFKSKAEKARFAKVEEERVTDEAFDHIKALVDAYGEPLEVGEYIKLGCVKMTKKEKDGVPFIDFKVKL
jgi:hypothetical protein